MFLDHDENKQLARELNVDELEFDHTRAMYNKPDIEVSFEQRSFFNYDNHKQGFWHIMARWRIGNDRYSALVPVELIEHNEKETFLGLNYKRKKWFEVNRTKILDKLRNLIERSRNTRWV